MRWRKSMITPLKINLKSVCTILFQDQKPSVRVFSCQAERSRSPGKSPPAGRASIENKGFQFRNTLLCKIF